MKPIHQRIEDAVRDLNFLYGRGNFRGVTFRKDGRHSFTRYVPMTQATGFEETRRFRTRELPDGKTLVTALSHRRVLK